MKRLLKFFTPAPQHPAPPVMEKAAETQANAGERAAAPGTDRRTLVLIAAALAAYGYLPSQIVAIRTLGSPVWTQAGRVETVQNRNRMFY